VAETNKHKYVKCK